jgi:hypothetical protein
MLSSEDSQSHSLITHPDSWGCSSRLQGSEKDYRHTSLFLASSWPTRISATEALRHLVSSGNTAGHRIRLVRRSQAMRKGCSQYDQAFSPSLMASRLMLIQLDLRIHRARPPSSSTRNVRQSASLALAESSEETAHFAVRTPTWTSFSLHLLFYSYALRERASSATPKSSSLTRKLQ